MRHAPSCIRGIVLVRPVFLSVGDELACSLQFQGTDAPAACEFSTPVRTSARTRVQAHAAPRFDINHPPPSQFTDGGQSVQPGTQGLDCMSPWKSVRQPAPDPVPTGVLLCPRCGRSEGLVGETHGGNAQTFRCLACGTGVATRASVSDFAPHLAVEGGRLHWKQKVMNSPEFARLYETAGWRPFHAYVASHGSLKREMADVLGLAGDGPVQVAVDLACGTGLYARALAQKHPRATVVGIDISVGMLSRAQLLAQEAGLSRLHFIRGDIQRLPLADGSVDHINCCAALHLFPDLPHIWHEIHRVLKPGGVFTAMTVAQRPLGPYSFQAFLQRVLSFKFFEPDLLAAELQSAGLVDFERVIRHSALMFRVVRSDKA